MILQSIPQFADVDRCIRQRTGSCTPVVQQRRQAGEWVGESYASRV